MSQPPDYHTLKKSQNLPPPPTDLERMRVHDLIAHDRAWLNDDPCPVPACTRCIPENQ